MPTDIIPSPGTRIMVGDRSLLELQPQELIAPALQSRADALVEREEVFELVGNQVAEQAATNLMKELSQFEKDENERYAIDTAPFKAAITHRQTARDLLLGRVLESKERIRNMLEVFGKKQALKREEEAKARAAEVLRLQREAAEIERKRKALEEEQARKAREEEARIAREKREAEEKAERERQAAAEEQARLKHETEEVERRGTAEQMEKARKAEADAKAKAEAEEKARLAAQAETERIAAEEKAKLEADAKRQQEEFSLRQAELNTAAADVSRAPESSKPVGLSGTFKWKAKPADESSEESIRVCMEQAFAVKPEWFDLKARLRVIEADLKSADGKLEVAGLIFVRDYAVKTR